MNAIFDHIEYLVNRFGADQVANGKDIDYTPLRADAEYRKMGRWQISRPRYEALWPGGALDIRSHPSLAWTNWPMFTVGMVQRGLSDTDIQKVLGGNVMRVARAVLASRA
jgi:membrane dipeptidase